MSERDKLLRFYRASGDDELAAKLLDLADSAMHCQKYRVSEFLDPYGLSIAETVAAHYSRLSLVVDGGIPGAERVKAAYVDVHFMGKVDFGLAALALDYESRYYHLSHRDILGSLLGLGLKREVIGDIIHADQQFQMIIERNLADYVIQNLNKVGTAPVTVSLMSLTDMRPREEKIKEIKTTVASLRLDVVAAAGFGTSRTKMAAEIDSDKVKVNWQNAKSSSQPVKAGDKISIRGRGRVEVCDIIGTTKKGRISIFLKRFL